MYKESVFLPIGGAKLTAVLPSPACRKGNIDGANVNFTSLLSGQKLTIISNIF